MACGAKNQEVHKDRHSNICNDGLLLFPLVQTNFPGSRCNLLIPENFTKLFEDYLNLGGKQFQEGRLVGLHLRRTHRTLQRLAVCFALGLVVGLSEQDRTDPRNGEAIETAKKLAEMVREGELPMGFYL